MFGIKRFFVYLLLPAMILVWISGDALLLSLAGGTYRMLFTRIMLLLITGVLVVTNRARLFSFWNQSGSGFNLAMFRVFFFGFFVAGLVMFGTQPLEKTVLSMIDLPPDSRVPLPLLGRLSLWIPVNKTLCWIGIGALSISSVFAFLGFKTRWAISVFTLSALYIFGVPQLYGKINHNHHLVWFPAILAFSGCGDFLSVDCWLRNRSLNACFRSRTSQSYGRAFAGIWLLIGIIYFFPGFQKIWQSGLDWMFSDNLLNLVHHKSLELPGWEPLLPVFEFPLLTRFLTAGAVVFEIGFIFAVANPRYRTWAIAGGLLFHAGTWLLLDIFFVVLALSYTSFVNWEKWLRIKAAQEGGPDSKANTKALTWISAFLVWGTIFCGAFNIHSWPLSAYPSFSVMPGPEADALEFEEESPEGARVIPLNRFHVFFPAERFSAMEFRAINLYRSKKFYEFKTVIRGMTGKLGSGKKIRVYLVKISWPAGKPKRERVPEPIMKMN